MTLRSFMANIVLSIYCFSGILISKSNATENELPASNINNFVNNSLNNNLYILGPGDILNLTVYGDTQYSGIVKILRDGTITFPFSDEVRIEGLTLKETKKYLQSILNKELINTDLKIELIEIRPIKVTVLGEVKKPGFYYLTSKMSTQNEAFANQATLFEAIKSAGGVNLQADLSNISLRRKLPKSDTHQYKEAEINLVKLIKNGDMEQNPFLFDGDVIIVKKGKLKTPEQFISTSANLVPDKILIYVIGEVQNPGQIEINANTPFSQAIYAAGGPMNGRSFKGKVELLRVNSNGSVNVQKINLDLAKKMSDSENPLLQDGDVIRVRRNLLARSSDTLGIIAEPTKNILPLFYLYQLLGFE